MSDVIKLLPDSVANQIAAGEVIQRPASVIKELVENAVDAKATSIQIILKDAGRTLIQVIDNGGGMSETDARLAFERHSTSKIRKADDLFSLHTMGFRGEALASIAAIAQVELKTQCEGAAMGTQIFISGSKCEKQEPIYYGKGSNFMIKNIFYNVPARRKFLKNNQIELSNILREFERLALVNHDIEFLINHNDNTLFQLMSGNFKQRIAALFGRSFETQLIPVNLDTSLIRIEGFVCRPENARKRNQQQFLFVNGRYMRHPYFHKAIMSSYDQLIPNDEQPNYFLNLTVDPDTIDVNIHPTKTEIKFENEQSIWQIISAAVKEAVGRFSVAPSIDFDMEGAPNIPVYSKKDTNYNPQPSVNPGYNPFNQSRSSSDSSFATKEPVSKDWEKLYEDFIQKKDEADDVVNPISKSDVEQIEVQGTLIDEDFSTKYLQLKGKYILSQIKSGLMIIDQHRAHTRILFEQFMTQRNSGIIATQRVLFPEILHLSMQENIVLEGILDEIKEVGFELSFLGDNDWSINGVPSGIENLDVQDTLHQVIESVLTGGDSLALKIFEKIALEVSQRSAIPYGKMLDQEEMDTLQCQLLQLPKPNYTPDGKLIIHVMPIDNFQKIFQ